MISLQDIRKKEIVKTFLKYRKYFAVSLLVGLVAIPLMDVFVVQRDRNRNILYGGLFWEYGFEVYGFNDDYLYREFNVSEDSLLGPYMNVTYEYPPATLLFFAGFAGLPLPEEFRRIAVNFVLFVIANINVLLMLEIGKKHRGKRWFHGFVLVYYMAEWVLSVLGGKEEPLANLFLLSAIYFLKTGRHARANILLATAVIVKVYPIALFPFFLLKSKKKIAWFFLALSPLIFLWLLNTQIGDSFLKHITNESNYSVYYSNPLYYGHAVGNPLSIITLVVFLPYLFRKLKEVKDRKNSLLFLLMLLFFAVGWQMPWYFAWMLPLALIIENEKDMKAYLKVLGLLGLLYLLGLAININYYVETNLLRDLAGHFDSEAVMNEINGTIGNLTATFFEASS